MKAPPTMYRRIESVLDDAAADELRKSVDATNGAWLGEVCDPAPSPR